MAEQKFYATGKRKTAIAKVWLKPGKGDFVVNRLTVSEYFGGGDIARLNVEKPMVVTDTLGQFDVVATLYGGGKSAQSDALRHGIAKALLGVNPEHRVVLKKSGFLTRDPRMKERKKYGLRSARARFQFSKR